MSFPLIGENAAHGNCQAAALNQGGPQDGKMGATSKELIFSESQPLGDFRGAGN